PPSCGNPPFDSAAPDIRLFSLPWTEWPIYDPAIFDVERERIQRWYQARGYYDAHVLSVRTLVDDEKIGADECPAGADCKLKVVVEISEGEPTHVNSVKVVPSTQLPAAFLEDLQRRLSLQRGVRFDEASYNADKAMLEDRLIRASYARAKVSGNVRV